MTRTRLAAGLRRCVNDVFFIVHQSKLDQFVTALGTSRGANSVHAQCGCFDASCSKRRVGLAAPAFHRGSGHDCFNVLSTLVGTSAIEFCWPDVRWAVSEPNKHYELPRQQPSQHTSVRTPRCVALAQCRAMAALCVP